MESLNLRPDQPLPPPAPKPKPYLKFVWIGIGILVVGGVVVWVLNGLGML
jgi:hypothetical protein